jgi:hypothetical protein
MRVECQHHGYSAAPGNAAGEYDGILLGSAALDGEPGKLTSLADGPHLEWPIGSSIPGFVRNCLPRGLVCQRRNQLGQIGYRSERAE